MAMKYLLAAPGRQKFVVFLADDGPSLHTEDYIQQLLTNFCEDSAAEDNPSKKYQIHLLLFAYNRNNFVLNRDVVKVYDVMNDQASAGDLDQVYNILIDNVTKEFNSCPHILIIDDFSIFSLLSSNRECSKITRFFRKISNKFQKIFVFAHKLTISSSETAILYDVASAVAILGSCYGTGSIQKYFVCDLLKIKPERRVSHEQSKFQVINGEVVEQMDDDQGRIMTRYQEDILKTLTTFKLTLEDNEKESRSKLYLPYFDAQKITVEDPDNYDDFEDEDDEEV